MAQKSDAANRLLKLINKRMPPALRASWVILHRHYANRIQERQVRQGDRRSRPFEFPARDTGEGVFNWVKNGVEVKNLTAVSKLTETGGGTKGGGLHLAELTKPKFNRLGPDAAFHETLAQLRAAFKANLR